MYDDEDDLKVYLIYTCKKVLYAWTTSKKEKNLFIQQRKNSKFIVKKVVMNSMDYRVFMVRNKNKQIVDIPIESGGETYSLIATYEEDQMLEKEVDQLENRFEKVKKHIKQIEAFCDIPEKYLDAMKIMCDYNELVESYFNPGKKDNIFNINSLTLFMDTFKNSF